MKKGSDGSKVLTVLSNSGSSGSYSVTLDAGYSGGTQLVDLYSCNKVKVGSDGKVKVQISSGMPQVLISASNAGDVCGGSS